MLNTLSQGPDELLEAGHYVTARRQVAPGGSIDTHEGLKGMEGAASSVRPPRLPSNSFMFWLRVSRCSKDHGWRRQPRLDVLLARVTGPFVS